MPVVFLEMYAAALLALATREAAARARAWAFPPPAAPGAAAGVPDYRYGSDSDGGGHYANL